MEAEDLQESAGPIISALALWRIERKKILSRPSIFFWPLQASAWCVHILTQIHAYTYNLN